MTIMRISFAGKIVKAEHKQAGSKPICEISLCRKHKGRNGAEDSFTWLRVTLWEPAEFQAAKLVKGSFIAGSGDVQLRGFEHNGVKKQSLECRCSSFDVEVDDGTTAQPASAATAKPQQQMPASSGHGDDEPPF